MTIYQLIALLFPVGTAIGVGLTAWGVVRWADRKCEAEKAKERALRAGASGPSVIDLLGEAASLIQKAQRQLQEGPKR